MSLRMGKMWDERREPKYKRKIVHQFMCPITDDNHDVCGKVFKTIKALAKHKSEDH